MKKGAVFLLGLLAVTLDLTKAQYQGCNYEQVLATGVKYFITNPGYPNKYMGWQSCQWVARGDYPIRLTCDQFQLPYSANCSLDNMSVRVADKITQRYCGDGTFTAVSKENWMVITLQSRYDTPGGRFRCGIEVVKPENPGEPECRCGWKNPTRIVGGVETGVNEYPMMAGLVDKGIREVICGATIISNFYAVTAAHCVHNRQITQLGLLVGDHDLSTGMETNATVLLKIADIRIHPQLDLQNNQNDIAVVKTEQRIIFSGEVGPACLPFQHRPDTFAGNFVDVLGWGTVEFAGQKSDTLQKITISVITNADCVKTYPTVTRQQLCTLGDQKDACQFDSGGPVLWQNPTTKRLVYVALITYGGVCGTAAGVNTRIGAYIDWIVSVTPDAYYCTPE